MQNYSRQQHKRRLLLCIIIDQYNKLSDNFEYSETKIRFGGLWHPSQSCQLEVEGVSNQQDWDNADECVCQGHALFIV